MIKKIALLTLMLVMFVGITNVSSQIAPEYFCGDWGDNGTKIKINGNKVTVVLAPSANRPNGTGTVNADNTITVNFPDDRTYTGKLVSINQINWGGNNNWNRSKLTPEDFAGDFGDNGTKIQINGNKVTVVLAPSANRPNGTGTVNADNTITVNFPDDKTYTGKLVFINQINWGGNNNWFRSKGTCKYYTK